MGSTEDTSCFAEKKRVKPGKSPPDPGTLGGSREGGTQTVLRGTR